MCGSVRSTPFPVYFVALSILGLILSAALSLYPPTTLEDFTWRRPLIGSTFSLICILGILAVLFPRQCSGKFASHGTSSEMKGHHPDCEGFSPHVFRAGDRTFCTACTGLLIGGLVALSGTFLCFFGECDLVLNNQLLVWIGLVGVGFGLFQYKAERRIVRLSLNTFFVAGAFLSLLGVEGLTRSVFADLVLVLLAVFWLFTRILLSQWDHERICHVCTVTECEFQ